MITISEAYIQIWELQDDISFKDNQSNQSNNKPDDVIIVESDSGFVSINKPSSKELSESFL